MVNEQHQLVSDVEKLPLFDIVTWVLWCYTQYIQRWWQRKNSFVQLDQFSVNSSFISPMISDKIWVGKCSNDLLLLSDYICMLHNKHMVLKCTRYSPKLIESKTLHVITEEIRKHWIYKPRGISFRRIFALSRFIIHFRNILVII